MKKLLIIALSSILIFACSKDQLDVSPSADNDSTERRFGQKISQGGQTFIVRIENITSGNTFVTPFSPGLFIVQKNKQPILFIDGQPDFGIGLEDIAEDGDPSVLNMSLERHPLVRRKGIFNTPDGASMPGPIFPGDAYEFEIRALPNDRLNFATMFIQSNDLFVGPDSKGIPLFGRRNEPLSGDITHYLELWDAGTEVNEEPGVGPNQPLRQSGPDTGLDENGVVQIVNDGYSYPAVADMLKVTISPQ